MFILTPTEPIPVIRTLSVDEPPDGVVCIDIIPSSLSVVLSPAAKTILPTRVPSQFARYSAKCCPAPVRLLSPTKMAGVADDGCNSNVDVPS